MMEYDVTSALTKVDIQAISQKMQNRWKAMLKMKQANSI